MRSLSVRLAALVLLLSGGCLWCPQTRPGAWLKSFRPVTGPPGGDIIVMHVSTIEQPVGNRYLNKELWATIDEGVVALDRKAVLEDNGFRVAVAGGGITAAGLHALLTSERSNPHPHEMRALSGSDKLIPLGGVRSRCAFEVHLDGPATTVEFEQAQCVLTVTPSQTADGLIKLAFAPQVLHGAAKLLTQNEHGDFVLHGRRPTQQYPALAFEVTLNPQDYVVIGTWAEQGQTLGHRCFVTSDGPKPIQRLLAIRASRLASPTSPSGHETSTDAAAKTQAPPLASQAALTVRGTSP